MNLGKMFLFFIFLGTLVSFGPFITDMYLVALPEMMSYFNADMHTIQFTLTFSMLGLACGQIFFGYVGDKYGRKYPLIIALTLFVLFTLLSIILDDVKIFIFDRFMQGFSGAGCIVLARSIIPDLFKKEILVKAISVTTVIYTINRIVSPIIGGYAFKISGWKGIFVCLLILGIILLMASFFMPETNTKKDENTVTLKSSFVNLCKNKIFIYYTAAFTFILTMQFAYIASCSFIFQKHYEVTPLFFSYVFAFNASIFGIGAFLPSKLKIDEKGMINVCSGLFLTCLLLTVIPLVNANVYVYEIILVFFRFLTGICFTLFMSKALEACRDNAGLGAAFLGTFYFLFGSIVTPLVGYGNMFYSSGSIMSFFSVLCLLIIVKLAYQAKNIEAKNKEVN